MFCASFWLEKAARGEGDIDDPMLDSDEDCEAMLNEVMGISGAGPP